MRKSWVLWVLSLLITFFSAYYQRLTGPTYPVKGKKEIQGQTVNYNFERSHSGFDNQKVFVTTQDSSISGLLYYKRYKTKDEWTSIPLQRIKDTLFAELPGQPAAGKLMYYVKVQKADRVLQLTEEPLIIRWKGEVPAAVLIPHVLIMFAAMLLSTRTGFEVLRENAKLKTYTLWTLIIMFVGGLILGPIVQKFAFDAYWTGFPFGYDLTDNKTLIAFLAWCAAFIAVIKKKNEKKWIIAAAIITLIIFLIPHSMFGSELKYE